jgi:hypothetical protein
MALILTACSQASKYQHRNDTSQSDKNADSMAVLKTQADSFSGDYEIIDFAKYVDPNRMSGFSRKDSLRNIRQCEGWRLSKSELHKILLNLTPTYSEGEWYEQAIFRGECEYRGHYRYQGKVYEFKINAGGWGTMGHRKYPLNSRGKNGINRLFLDTFSTE